MLPCICSVIDHRGCQKVAHSAIASCATFLFLPHFDLICDILLNRCTAAWKLFVLNRNMENMFQNVNSLCSCHHYINTLSWLYVSIELSKNSFKPISMHICFGLHVQYCF